MMALPDVRVQYSPVHGQRRGSGSQAQPILLEIFVA